MLARPVLKRKHTRVFAQPRTLRRFPDRVSKVTSFWGRADNRAVASLALPDTGRICCESVADQRGVNEILVIANACNTISANAR